MINTMFQKNTKKNIKQIKLLAWFKLLQHTNKNHKKKEFISQNRELDIFIRGKADTVGVISILRNTLKNK